MKQEDVFKALGFGEVESLDVSDYEGAPLIYYLNQPQAPEHLVGKFDLVFTGGTLEHVFHISRALQHTASFVRTGGCLVHISPPNNWMKHGFYQLGPEWLSAYFQQNGWCIHISAIIDMIEKLIGLSNHPAKRFEGSSKCCTGSEFDLKMPPWTWLHPKTCAFANMKQTQTKPGSTNFLR
ncbi:MAG: hypothetical protein ACWA49_10820 [Ruegeria sp.]